MTHEDYQGRGKSPDLPDGAGIVIAAIAGLLTWALCAMVALAWQNL